MAVADFEPLRVRVMAFAVAVVKFCRTLPETWEGRSIRAQLFRCGTAVAANYQAARRSRSHREFIARLAVVVEADEVCYWLHLLTAAHIQPTTDPARLHREAGELLRIFSASLSTAKANRQGRKTIQPGASVQE